jgi:hypothetical protein
MRPLLSLRAALEDPRLLGPVMGGESREPMRALLLASQGEELTASELAHFRRLTGRETPPTERVEEALIIAGRRAGKSSGVAALAVYAAALCDYSDRLQAGERGVVLITAENTKQARVILGYICGVFDGNAALRSLIANRTSSSLSLSNQIDVEVRACDFRSLRGLTLVMAIADEIAFWRDDSGGSSNPDTEVVESIRPGLATASGQLVAITSPYSRRGYAFTTFSRHHGKEGDPRILVAKGATRDFNSTISQATIDRAYERDPQVAASEWGGEFRSDLEQFVRREVVIACTVPNRFELPRAAGVRYHGFTDPSGGSADSFTLAIGHAEGEKIIIDALRERRPPFNPSDVVEEYSSLLKAYGVSRIEGDCYARCWPRAEFRKHGVAYEPCGRPKSSLYLEMLPLLNGGRVELLDHPRMASQLIALERRTSRSGKDSVDHPAGAGSRDDLINSVAGVVAMAGSEAANARPLLRFSWT